MTRPLIYISGPITNGGTASKRDVETHVSNAQSVAVDLIKVGFAVYCPQSSGSWQREREVAYDEWLDHDFEIIDRCDAVYRLPGESRGADAEVEYARGKAIPVFHAGEHTYERLRQIVSMAVIERQLEESVKPLRPVGTRLCDTCGKKPGWAWYSETPEGPADKTKCRACFDSPPDAVSGGMVRYASGAVRSSDREAYRYDLIAPEGLRRLAMTCAEGAAKYGDHNWEKGMPASVFANHALAHVACWLDGDEGEDHLAHAAWNLIAIMHFEKHGRQWIDCGPSTTAEIDIHSALAWKA